MVVGVESKVGPTPNVLPDVTTLKTQISMRK
jgi:hypothetical protein